MMVTALAQGGKMKISYVWVLSKYSIAEEGKGISCPRLIQPKEDFGVASETLVVV